LTEGQAKLDKALTFLRARLAETIQFKEEDRDAMAATNGLLRVMVAQAEAIAVLSTPEIADSAGSNIRTLYEAWVDLRVILIGDRNQNGAQFRLFGLLQFRRHANVLMARQEDVAAAIAEIDSDLERYRKLYPALVAKVEAMKGNFWSGQTRKAMLIALEEQLVKSEAATLMDIYKIFSWQAHSTLAAVLGLIITEEDGETRMGFGPYQTPEFAADYYCTIAERLLGDAWKSFENAFDLEPRTQ
jgi:hypothetical protein